MTEPELEIAPTGRPNRRLVDAIAAEKEKLEAVESMRAKCEAIAWDVVNRDWYAADVAHAIAALKVES